jgi:hypothetical protein
MIVIVIVRSVVILLISFLPCTVEAKTQVAQRRKGMKNMKSGLKLDRTVAGTTKDDQKKKQKYKEGRKDANE